MAQADGVHVQVAVTPISEGQVKDMEAVVSRAMKLERPASVQALGRRMGAVVVTGDLVMITAARLNMPLTMQALVVTKACLATLFLCCLVASIKRSTRTSMRAIWSSHTKLCTAEELPRVVLRRI